VPCLGSCAVWPQRCDRRGWIFLFIMMGRKELLPYEVYRKPLLGLSFESITNATNAKNADILSSSYELIFMGVSFKHEWKKVISIRIV